MDIAEIKSKLVTPNDIPIGMQGTSYEMVIHLFENGVLTPNPDSKATKRRGGQYLYFWPLHENWEANGLTPLSTRTHERWDPVYWSERFARGASEQDFFERICGFNIEEYKHLIIESRVIKVKNAMQERNLSDSDIADLIREIERRKGFRITLHPQVVQAYQVEPDSYFGPDHFIAFQVKCPDGIDSRYIAQVIPIGDYDRRLLDKYLAERQQQLSPKLILSDRKC